LGNLKGSSLTRDNMSWFDVNSWNGDLLSRKTLKSEDDEILSSVSIGGAAFH